MSVFVFLHLHRKWQNDQHLIVATSNYTEEEGELFVLKVHLIFA